VAAAPADGRTGRWRHDRAGVVPLWLRVPEVAGQPEEVTHCACLTEPGRVGVFVSIEEDTMAISHADHDHPNTPAARAKCRKEMGKATVTGRITDDALSDPKPQGVPATWHVKPKGKVPAALKVNDPGARKNIKRLNSLIKNVSDLADVPQALAHGIREAWARDLDVRVGDRFRNDEARVVIQADLAEIALVWKDSNVHGVHAIWVRNWDSSKAFKVNSVAEAFMVAETRELWDEHGNLRTA